MNASLEDSLKQFSEAQLRPMLAEVQLRLGGPGELPGDFELARALAHQINNRRTAARIAADLSRLTALP
jgi:hypothetical protein